MGSHKLWPQRRHWVKILSLASHDNWRLQGTLPIIKCINAFLCFPQPLSPLLQPCPHSAVMISAKKKKGKLEKMCKMCKMQESRWKEKHLLLAQARSTITTCNLKVICSQKESSTFATILSNMFEINKIPFWFFLQTAMTHFTKITLETASKNTELEIDSVFCLKLE